MPLINYIGNRQESLGGGAGGFERGLAPIPPSLNVQYLVVGGGSATTTLRTQAGNAGGVVSGSLTIPFSNVLNINVGSGGVVSDGAALNGGSSSVSSSTLGFIGAGGGTFGNSGGPQYFNVGIGTGAGGAGSSKDGNNAVGGNGDGGTGSLWLNGKYYAGGGAGGNGTPGLGGGGAQISGFYPDGQPYQVNGVDGLGGGMGQSGSLGGSGVVILRFSTSSLVPPYDNAIWGGTRLISGGYVYHTFTGSGQFYYQY